VLEARSEQSVVDEQTIELIAQRVISAIREDLDAIAHGLSAPAPTEQLTVGQVARKLGVARSTVYAHWREWGGYKLGAGAKAPIRFDHDVLPTVGSRTQSKPPLRAKVTPRHAAKKRHRRDLLGDAPRLVPPLNRGS
jgi:hypothetical protein